MRSTRRFRTIDETHFTWVGPYCPALEQQPDREFTDRAATLVRKMGYQFAIKELRHSATVATGDTLTSSLIGENMGVAPFYYCWQAELGLLDQQGNLVEKLPLDWDVRKWLSGKFQVKAAPPVTAKPGSYQLAVGILDPWTDRPAIQFANELPRQDGWTIVSQIEVR